MKITKLHDPQEVAETCVVVIDVLRAFTTAAFAFSRGASKIIAVSTQEEAFALRDRNSNYLIMGELNGLPIPGFNYSNSPTEISQLDLKGRTLIQRTSAGTQGIVRSFKSDTILISSFVVAEATLKRIRQLNPPKLAFIITGTTDGDEDLALAEYLESKIHTPHTDPQPYIHRVKHSPEGLFLSTSTDPRHPQTDLHCATSLDKFPFAMEVFKENGLPVIYPVDEMGNCFKLSV